MRLLEFVNGVGNIFEVDLTVDKYTFLNIYMLDKNPVIYKTKNSEKFVVKTMVSNKETFRILDSLEEFTSEIGNIDYTLEYNVNELYNFINTVYYDEVIDEYKLVDFDTMIANYEKTIPKSEIVIEIADYILTSYMKNHTNKEVKTMFKTCRVTIQDRLDEKGYSVIVSILRAKKSFIKKNYKEEFKQLMDLLGPDFNNLY